MNVHDGDVHTFGRARARSELTMNSKRSMKQGFYSGSNNGEYK